MNDINRNGLRISEEENVSWTLTFRDDQAILGSISVTSELIIQESEMEPCMKFLYKVHLHSYKDTFNE